MKIKYKVKERKLADDFAKGLIQIECYNHKKAEELVLLMNKLYGFKTANDKLTWGENDIGKEHTRLSCAQEREFGLNRIISSSERSGHKQYYKTLPIVDVDKLLNEE